MKGDVLNTFSSTLSNISQANQTVQSLNSTVKAVFNVQYTNERRKDKGWST